MIQRLLGLGRRKILTWSITVTIFVTALDWITGNEISLAAIYIIPVMLGAIAFRPVELALFSVGCSYLRSWFDVPGSPVELVLRFIFAAIAYFVSGLFVGALIKNREQAVRHLEHIEFEQKLRRDAEEQLRLLAASSPAAIVTVDGAGIVLAANSAARSLLLVPQGTELVGQQLLDYFPFLKDALRLDTASLGLRTAVKARGFRGNGEMFLAHMWFSSYVAPEGKRLAAIIVDSSEELRDREEHSLHQLLMGNEIATAAIAHEVRNVSEAMGMLCEDLRERYKLGDDKALRGLNHLVEGLEAIASFDLNSENQEVQQVSLGEVLDNLRIVVEPAWREIEGMVRWELPPSIPNVWAEPHGLLQACLNLAQNSHRAVQNETVRELCITVYRSNRKVAIEFVDSGRGVAVPEALFRPFQHGAQGSGLGLFVSRFIIRRFGGELRFLSRTSGSCFVIELEAVQT